MLQIEHEHHGMKDYPCSIGLNKTLHHLASTSMTLCEKKNGELLRLHFERLLELFRKSELNVKMAIANVYLESLILNTQFNAECLRKISQSMPEELKRELQRYNVSQGEITKLL